jgi:hypothetical protein
MSKFDSFDVHGGPPLIHVPEHISSTKEAYYLGIMHHYEMRGDGCKRLYRHFAYKASPQPPFDITAISDELPLTFKDLKGVRHARCVAFVSGLDITENGTILITYGSADIESRILILTLDELDLLFTGEVAFRDIKLP